MLLLRCDVIGNQIDRWYNIIVSVKIHDKAILVIVDIQNAERMKGIIDN